MTVLVSTAIYNERHPHSWGRSLYMAPDAGLVLRLAHRVLAQDDGSRLSIWCRNNENPPLRGVGFRYLAPDAGLEPATR